MSSTADVPCHQHFQDANDFGTGVNSTAISSQRNGPDASGLQACQLLRSSPGSSRTTERLTIQRGRSHGKFCGLIPTRSVAESVFTTHLLQEIRDKRLDLDAIAEAMHTKAGTTIPNKTTQARAFHSPLITLLTDQLQAHAPAVAEGSALRALKATSDDLARAREKLQAHGLELTPKKDTGRPSAPSAPVAPPTSTTSTPRRASAVLPHPQGRRPRSLDRALHPTVDAYF